MALTPEVLKANEQLASLSDEQIAAVTQLSVNDEQTVINSKVGEIHGGYDKDVLEVTGIEKNQSEKSYDYVKRVLGDFKTKISGFGDVETKISGYETKISELESQIANGKGNEAINQQLNDTKSQLSQLQSQYDADKQNWENEKSKFGEQMTSFKVNSEIEKATAGLKFKSSYPESVQQTLLNSAKDSLLTKFKPDFIDSEGNKVMIFRNEQGEIVRNKSNALNPYTAKELITEQLKDVIDLGQTKTGAGTTNVGGKGDIEIVDISGAKTQVQADEMIVKYLMQSGETRGSQSFAEKQKSLRIDNGVDKLPLR